MKERTASRGGPRIPVALKGTLRLGEGAAARVLPLVTRDLGAGGAQAGLAEPIPVGTEALLRLALPAERGVEAPITLSCRVVRVEGAGPAEVALAFHDTPPAVLETLKRFLFRARDKSGR